MEGNGGQLPCLNLWCNEGREVASTPLRSFRDYEPRVFQRSRWTNCLGSSARLSFIVHEHTRGLYEQLDREGAGAEPA
jgi:hypothetical protein